MRIAAAATLAVVGAARAEVRTKVIDYTEGGTPLRGFLAWDDSHEAWGETEHARNPALRLAKAGYVGFALDMYGNGKVATHLDDAKAYMQEASKDAAVLRARFEAAMKVLKAQPPVDPQKIGAVGYCFGGGVALGMARAGEPLTAVSTFHAAMPTTEGPPPEKVKPRILINTGAADPLVPQSKVDAFAKELKDAGAEVTVIAYPNARHSFTVPDADKAGLEAVQYDADADRRSWEATVKMFREAFTS
jgi:dienelactone hydrolase